MSISCFSYRIMNIVEMTDQCLFICCFCCKVSRCCCFPILTVLDSPVLLLYPIPYPLSGQIQLQQDKTAVQQQSRRRIQLSVPNVQNPAARYLPPAVLKFFWTPSATQKTQNLELFWEFFGGVVTLARVHHTCTATALTKKMIIFFLKIWETKDSTDFISTPPFGITFHSCDLLHVRR